MKKFQARQGDIFFTVVAKPKNLHGMKIHDSRILAFGEVTGHSHALKEGTAVQRYINIQGDIYLFSEERTIVVHDEHSDTELPANKWIKVTRQREYSPMEESRQRKVED